MIGLLIVGFVANELIRPVHPKYHEPATADGHGTDEAHEEAAP